MASDFKITSGNTKGTPLEKATDQDIIFCGKRHLDDLVKEPGGQYAGFKVKWLAAARGVLNKRGSGDLPELTPSQEVLTAVAAAAGGNSSGGAQGVQGGAFRAKPAQQPAAATPQRPAASEARALATVAAQQRSQEQLVATRDIGAVNAQLEDFASKCILVSPATSCAALPEGCEVAFSLLRVDPRTDKEGGPGDVVGMPGGKLALSGTVMKKIAAAAGVDWVPSLSGRLDDDSDPNYCHYRAVGMVRGFDGSIRHVTGEVQIDLRDGSSQIEAMYARARGDASNVDNQIRDMRLFLVRHAETKAKLRAVTDLGLKRSYTKEELSKPFAIPKLMFTGRSDNPQIAMMMAEKIADAHTAAIRGLYGAAATPSAGPRALAAPAVHHHHVAPRQFAGHAPPPLGSVVDTDAVDIPPARPTPQPQQPQPQPQGESDATPPDDDHDPGFDDSLAT